MLTNDLVEYAIQEASNLKVLDIRAGLSYTGLVLEDGGCGLAYTFRNELGCYCGILNEAGNLIGRSCGELIPWVDSSNRLKAAIGLAAMNSVLNRADRPWPTGNITTSLEVEPTDMVGMVGEFRPILQGLSNRVNHIIVFDQKVTKDPSVHSPEEIPKYLPSCNVILITATTIINHTIDEVLRYCEGAREVCLVGPSTPLCPEVFQHYPVSLLAGDVVIDWEQTLRIISQGGGTMAMKHSIRHVLVPAKI